MHNNIQYSCIVLLEKNLPGAPVLVRGSQYLRFSMFTQYASFCVKFDISGPVVPEKKIFKHYSYVFLCYTLNPALSLYMHAFV